MRHGEEGGSHLPGWLAEKGLGHSSPKHPLPGHLVMMMQGGPKSVPLSRDLESLALLFCCTKPQRGIIGYNMELCLTW